jgi:hypothetical protein
MNYDKLIEKVNPGWLPYFEENENEIKNILE